MLNPNFENGQRERKNVRTLGKSNFAYQSLFTNRSKTSCLALVPANTQSLAEFLDLYPQNNT